MNVTCAQCYHELIERAGTPAVDAVMQWSRCPGYESVVQFVKKFNHSYLYEISEAELNLVKQKTMHALGDVKKEEQIQEVEDFTSPFALQHLFHNYIEIHRELPTWQDFLTYLFAEVHDLWMHPYMETIFPRLSSPRELWRFMRAMQWRLGKFYYSALREVEVVVKIWQRHGIPVRYHLLADVLLRTDLWYNNTAFCFYFPNPKYRDGQQGRKPPAASFLQQANPAFNIQDIPIERQGHGKLWQVSDQSIERIVNLIKQDDAV